MNTPPDKSLAMLFPFLPWVLGFCAGWFSRQLVGGKGKNRSGTDDVERRIIVVLGGLLAIVAGLYIITGGRVAIMPIRLFWGFFLGLLVADRMDL